MNEEQTNEKAEAKESAETEDIGGKYETTPVIERAREERERMESVLKELREENNRRELIITKQALGGVTEAGQSQKKEEKDSDDVYAQKALRGELGR